MLVYAAVTLVVTFGGGCLPLIRNWSHRQLHAVLALATGVFLGAVFLHLLPEISALEHENAGDLDSRTLWLYTLVATLSVYLFDALLFRSHDHDEVHRHRAVGYSALLGMSLHAFTEGVAFSVLTSDGRVALPYFLSTLGHKLLDGFSLASVLRLGDFSRVKIFAWIAAFAGLTPLGMLLGDRWVHDLSPHTHAIVSALAAGTFLFVSLCELLPEVFHHREDSTVKVSLLLAGIGASVLLNEVH